MPRYSAVVPTIHFLGQSIPCETGARLRDVLRSAGASPHNGKSRLLNCKGFGTCGTCAVQIEGPVSEPTARERARLAFPPHTPAAGLRLACQVRVQGDVHVTKHPGFWGQDVPTSTSSETPSASRDTSG